MKFTARTMNGSLYSVHSGQQSVLSCSSARLSTRRAVERHSMAFTTRTAAGGLYDPCTWTLKNSFMAKFVSTHRQRFSLQSTVLEEQRSLLSGRPLLNRWRIFGGRMFDAGRMFDGVVTKVSRIELDLSESCWFRLGIASFTLWNSLDCRRTSKLASSW